VVNRKSLLHIELFLSLIQFRENPTPTQNLLTTLFLF